MARRAFDIEIEESSKASSEAKSQAGAEEPMPVRSLSVLKLEEINNA